MLDQTTVLQRLVRRARRATEAAQERCDVCAEPIPEQHRHLLVVATREIQCLCRACAILFSQEAASQGRRRLVPERRLFLPDFDLDDARWAELGIPVGLAFLVESTPAGRAQALYPSPIGPTEARLDPASWRDLVAANPLLATLEPDVEALLVNRARGAREHYLVPIDECFRLVGLIRAGWRGLSGGTELWSEVGGYFARLRAASHTRRSDRQ